jgi:hypothetical protein
MLARFVVLAFSLALAAPAGAAELCQAPGPPPDQSLRPVAPTKPPTPSCINQETRMSSCRPAVFKAYNASVDAYNEAMIRFNRDGNGYIDALNHWSRSAVDYANCEVQQLNREVAP